MVVDSETIGDGALANGGQRSAPARENEENIPLVISDLFTFTLLYEVPPNLFRSVGEPAASVNYDESIIILVRVNTCIAICGPFLNHRPYFSSLTVR